MTTSPTTRTPFVLALIAGLLWLGSSPSRAQEPEAAGDFAAVDRTLVEIERFLVEGHFRTALAIAESARESLVRMADLPGASGRTAQLEVLVATSQVALSREAAARASFRRAIEADPDLSLDAAATSPRVMRVFEAARRSGSGS